MLSKTTIPIKNIYYMLAYTHKELKSKEYMTMGVEDFQDLYDLYTSILLISVPILIKGGLIKDYINTEEESFVIKGKVDLTQSISKNTLNNKKLIVNYDEYSENTLFNQIIKETLQRLSATRKISAAQRKEIKYLLPYFSMVSTIDLDLVKWDDIRFSNNSVRYEFTLKICQYIYLELLISYGEDTSLKEVYEERRLSTIFESFIFSFYKKETTFDVSSPQIKWKVEMDESNNLPRMLTDVVLKDDKRVIIIDTKFYTNNMLKRNAESKQKHISSNLYQICTYVDNFPEDERERKIEGMLLYAKTNVDVQPNDSYLINNKSISVRNVDLNKEFKDIKVELLNLLLKDS